MIGIRVAGVFRTGFLVSGIFTGSSFRGGGFIW